MVLFRIVDYTPDPDPLSGRNVWQEVGEQVVDALHFAGDQQCGVGRPEGFSFNAQKVVLSADELQGIRAGLSTGAFNNHAREAIRRLTQHP